MQQQKERREGEQRRPGQAKPQPINFRGKDIPAPALCMEIKCLGQRRKTKQQNRPVTVSRSFGLRPYGGMGRENAGQCRLYAAERLCGKNGDIGNSKLNAEGVTVSEVAGTYTYTGSEIKPPVAVGTGTPAAGIYISDSGAALTASDFTVSYSNHKDAGTASVTITGKGNYTGSVTRTFTTVKDACTDTLS